ncbi:hypothetical protein [Shewanella frigidimarina]|nr:hypothetical protein [Shewanella frigidimarina]
MSDKANELTFQNDIITQLIVHGWPLSQTYHYNHELAVYPVNMFGFVRET